MRILAVRGENLASLAGPFAVALDAPPLSGVGLFAITGPTGAGKSTLLDAICLALFDRAPRLDGLTSVSVGHADQEQELRTKNTDRQSLVRRGTGFGWAEVDYVGRDGRAYRARWEARRARKSPTGRWQDAEMHLVDLASGKPIGSGKKTDTLAAIERSLGLTYEQFRRSTLLAQNDFAAFLREKGPERAALLEQMTGTEIYSRISVAAHRRRKEAEDELLDLERRIEAVAVLSEHERRGLEQRRIELVDREANEGRHVERWRAAVHHAEEARRLAEEEVEAESALNDARRLLEESATTAEALQRAEIAFALRPRRASSLEAETRARRARSALSTAEERLAHVMERLEATNEAWASAEHARKEAHDALTSARPDLERARALDSRLHALGERIEAMRDAVAQAEGDHERAHAEVATVERRIEAVRQALALAELGLERNAAWAPLAREWERAHGELRSYLEAIRRHTEAREQIIQTEGLLEETRSRREQAAQAAERRSSEQAEAEAAWRSANDAAHALALSEDERRMREHDRRLLEVGLRLRELLPQKAHLDRRLEEEDRVQHEARRERAAAEARAIEAKRTLDALRGELRGAKDALERIRTTIALTTHRAALRDGEPCPLCGATEHPYRAEEAGGMLVDAQEDRVRDLERAIDAQVRAESRELELVDAWARTARESEARRGDLIVERDERIGRLVELARALDPEAMHPSVDDALSRLDGVVDRQRAWDEQESREKEARTLADRRFAAWEAGKDALRTSLDELARRDAEVASLEEDLARQREASRTAEADALRAERSLASVFPEIEEMRRALREDGEEFLRECEARVTMYRKTREARDSASLDRQALEGALRERRATLASSAIHLETRRDELASIEAERTRVEAERALVFGGRATQDLEQALEGTLREIEARFETARREHEEARIALEGARSDRTAAARAVEDATTAEMQANAELAAELLRSAMDREELDSWIARGDDWIEVARREIMERRRAIDQAAVVLEERRQRRRSFEERTPADLSAIDETRAREELERAIERQRELTREIAVVTSTLARDDEAKSQRSERGALLEAARRDAARWSTLDDLIGSADGKKFRRFAQSLTLEALLEAANAHLTDLAPRYRLMRVPGHDMELQIVDRDMADEVRSVGSLSGGETFLVSLALALGLSSLSARNVRIDSLFIDEGFGSLDPDTLETAVAALESLQATGRQVGVISHVASLAEKIGTEVRVERLGGGRSRVRTVGSGATDRSEEARHETEKKRRRSASTVD